MSEQRTSISLSSIFSILVVVLLILLLWQLKDLLVVAMTAVVLAVALDPAVDFAERLRFPRWLAVLTVYLSLIGGLVGVGLLIGPTVVQQTERLINQVPTYSESLYFWVSDLALRVNTARPDLIDQVVNPQALTNWVIRSGQQVLLRSVGLTRGLVGGALSVVLVLLLSGYMVAGSRSLLQGLVALFPEPWNRRLAAQVSPVGDRMAGFVQGRVIVSAILAIVITISLSLLGMKEVSLALGVIAGVTNLIPFVGPILGAIPAVVVAVSEGGLVWLWVLLLFVIVQNIEGNFLTPLVVGSSTKLHPLYMLLAVLAGTQLLGVVGAIILPSWVAGAAVLLENLYLQPKAIAEANRHSDIGANPESETVLTSIEAVSATQPNS